MREEFRKYSMVRERRGGGNSRSFKPKIAKNGLRKYQKKRTVENIDLSPLYH